ncbi:gap junction protein alpha 4 [Sardina pilchardus]|uniref:gap junction protein alpha 4 n=1 Tax=Sardina pilchardus TaxID=27697 RepID=UPI002E12AF98
MSRADWSFLEQLLEEGQENSTGVGRVWLTVLFLFRILALGTAAESAWDDEQSAFVCNTKQPGCEEVCYDQAFPVSHFRYFVLQIIFVSTPTIFYFGYVAVRAREEAEREARGGGGGAAEEEEEEEEEKKRKGQGRRSHGGGAEAGKAKLEVIQEDEESVAAEEKKEEKGGGGGGRKRGAERPRLKGRLLAAYAVSIALKLLLELGFMLGLWLLYGFTIPARYECRRQPCPHTVDCFVSRPTEKTIFTVYLQAIAGVSVLLNVLELLNLLQRAVTQRLEKRYRYRRQPWTRDIARAPSPLETASESTLAPAYEERGHQYLPGLDDAGVVPRTDQSWALEVGVGVGETTPGLTSDLLPSYLNCISGMRPLASGGGHQHRLQQHQQMHRQSKRNKHSHHKGGDTKHRHYV